MDNNNNSYHNTLQLIRRVEELRDELGIADHVLEVYRTHILAQLDIADLLLYWTENSLAFEQELPGRIEVIRAFGRWLTDARISEVIQ